MVCEIGSATSTFDLFDKLTEFMKTVNGWQLWSNIDGYDNRDFVYRSSGADGRKDIYIRQKVGQPEPFLSGAEQYDYDGNGDTGHLNFFSYLYFPYGGSIGASEVGVFGPRLFFFNGDDTLKRLYYQDFLGQKKAAASAIAYGTPAQNLDSPDTLVDTHCLEKRRWSALNVGNFGYSSRTAMTTDGKRYIYVSSSNGVYQYSMARAGGAFDTSGNISTTGVQISSETDVEYITFFENRETGTQHLFTMTERSSEGVTIYNLVPGGISGSTSVPGPTWPTNLSYGGTIYQYAAASCWDGKRYIYVLRGGTSTLDENHPSPDWGRFDTWTNTWITNSIPENPEFRGFYSLLGDFVMKFINKEITGYAYNRLYTFASGVLYGIDLNDEGMPDVSNPFWTIIDDPAMNVGGDDGTLIPVRSGRLFMASQYVAGPQNKYDTYQPRPVRFLYYMDFDPNGGEWMAADAGYFPAVSEYPEYTMVDGYACRVYSKDNTDYIFIGDEDRIIVATSSDNKSSWTVAYMGAFESAYDSEPYAVVDGDIKSGRFRKIKIKHKIGDFVVGDKYFITGNNGPITYQRYEPDGRTVPVGHSESITVSAIGDDFIMASIYNNYNDGAKISIDPQPVGVFLWELEKFQTTNVVNRLDDDFNGSDSPSKQTYTVPIAEGSIKSIQAIAGNITLSDCTIATGESEGNHIGRETRGRMKGIYAVGTNIAANSTIVVGNDAYKVINIPGYLNKHLVIGPIE